MTLSRRYYLCAVVGDGKTLQTSYRAKLPAGIAAHVALIPSSPTTGAPLFAWCLAQVKADAATHAAIAADAQTDPIPPLGLEERPVDFLTVPQQAAFATRLQNRGLTAAQAQAALGMALRQLVRALGRRLLAGFDESQFGVKG